MRARTGRRRRLGVRREVRASRMLAMFCAVALAIRSQVSNHRGLPMHGPLEAVSSGVRRRKRSHGVRRHDTSHLDRRTMILSDSRYSYGSRRKRRNVMENPRYST